MSANANSPPNWDTIAPWLAQANLSKPHKWQLADGTKKTAFKDRDGKFVMQINRGPRDNRNWTYSLTRDGQEIWVCDKTYAVFPVSAGGFTGTAMPWIIRDEGKVYGTAQTQWSTNKRACLFLFSEGTPLPPSATATPNSLWFRYDIEAKISISGKPETLWHKQGAIQQIARFWRTSKGSTPIDTFSRTANDLLDWHGQCGPYQVYVSGHGSGTPGATRRDYWMYRPQQDGDLPAFVQGLPAAGWTLGANNRFGDQQWQRLNIQGIGLMSAKDAAKHKVETTVVLPAGNTNPPVPQYDPAYSHMLYVGQHRCTGCHGGFLYNINYFTGTLCKSCHQKQSEAQQIGQQLRNAARGLGPASQPIGVRKSGGSRSTSRSGTPLPGSKKQGKQPQVQTHQPSQYLAVPTQANPALPQNTQQYGQPAVIYSPYASGSRAPQITAPAPQPQQRTGRWINGVWYWDRQ